MDKSYALSQEDLSQYVVDTFQPEDDVLKKIRQNQNSAGLPEIQVGPMDARHLEVFTRMCGAKTAVEIGTLGGYSGVSIARGLGAGGRLYTLEVNPKNAAVARSAFELAMVSDRVEILEGPALLNLPKLNAKGPFDLVFVDADKENYPQYLNWAAKNLRSGGVIIGDNTFGFGLIADPNISAEDRPSIDALRRFNKSIADRNFFVGTLIPTGEGLTIGVRV